MSFVLRRNLVVGAIALLNVEFAWLFVDPGAAQIYVPLAQTILFVGALVFISIDRRRSDDTSGPRSEELTDELPNTVITSRPTRLPDRSHPSDGFPGLPSSLSSPFDASESFGVIPKMRTRSSLELVEKSSREADQPGSDGDPNAIDDTLVETSPFASPTKAASPSNLQSSTTTNEES